MRSEPLVSIIIVNWNGGKVFEDCLHSLDKISYSNRELIIVDNGSTDGTQKHARIRNKTNTGFAPANNQGVKIAKGKYLLLLNNDTRVTRDFLSILVDRLELDSTIGVIQPKIFMMDRPGCLDNAGSFFTKIGFLEHWGFGQKDSKEFAKEAEIFSAKGACMLIRRETIERIGLFDPDFVSYFEESDFCWRVWLARWRVIYYPKSEIYHKVGFTIRRLDVSNINYHYYKNRITSLIKNLGVFNLIVVLPVHIILSVGIAVMFLFRGNLNNFLMITRAVFWNLFNLPKTLTKRKKVQKNRRVSDHVLFSELTRPVNFKKFFEDFKRVEKDLKGNNL